MDDKFDELIASVDNIADAVSGIGLDRETANNIDYTLFKINENLGQIVVLLSKFVESKQ